MGELNPKFIDIAGAEMVLLTRAEFDALMERIEAGESSVDGYAHEGSVVAMHAKTRENAVTGLAMDFRVIEAPDPAVALVPAPTPVIDAALDAVGIGPQPFVVVSLRERADMGHVGVTITVGLRSAE